MRTPAGSPRFATTRWSVVLAAGSAGHAQNEAESRAALESLCRAYWYPLYAYARRRGASAADAADLVQGFFAMFLERGALAAADPERGRFRGFLLTAFRRHTSTVRERAAAQKRGGGRAPLPFDMGDGESRYSLEPSDDRTPEALFERRWALVLLGRTVERLRAEGSDDAARTDLLLPLVGGPGEARPYAEIAAATGTTEDGVKSAVRRLRERFRRILREEIAATVDSAAEVDDEIRRMIAALSA